MNPRKVPLIDAVIVGDIEAVRALLAAGSDVNETGSGGRTPLILATLFGRTQIMTLLLEAGADPHQRDSLGLNAVDWADRKGLKLLNQRQARKQERPPVTSRNGHIPLGRLAPSKQRARTSASTQSANDDEKSRRWLAGFKRRIDEETSHKIKEVEPTQPPTAEVKATLENEPPRIVVNDSLVKISAPEPRAVMSAAVERLANFHTEVLPKDQILPVQPNDSLGPPDDLETLEPPLATSVTPSPESIHRQRCPKCNTVYASELLAYCAIDMTPLVDADQPLFTSLPETPGIPLVWLLVALTFIVAAGVTYFLIPYSRSEPNAPPKVMSPTAAQSIPNAPAVGGGLSGKQLEVPAAEYPATARTEHVSGTVTVRVTVNKQGKVIAVKALDGDWRLRKAAIAAALNATFSTDRLTERKTVGTIAYTFKE